MPCRIFPGFYDRQHGALELLSQERRGNVLGTEPSLFPLRQPRDLLRHRGRFSQIQKGFPVSSLAGKFANLYLRQRAPLSFIHFITNHCNARCPFCFIDFDDSSIYKGELTLQEIEDFAGKLPPSIFNINITGGEPFLRKDIKDILSIYYEATHVESFYITSNGFYVDRVRELAEHIQANFHRKQFRVYVAFSIDALGRRHDEIRRVKGLYEKVTECYFLLKGLQDARIRPHISLTISEENYSVAETLYEELVSRGVESIGLTAVREEGVYQTIEKKQEIVDTYQRLAQAIAEEEASRIKGFSRGDISGAALTAKNQIVRGMIGESYLNDQFFSPCPAGAKFFILHANGDVGPCEILDELYGNVRDFDYDISKLLGSPQAREHQKWIKDSKCRCTYECAMTINILSHLRYAPKLALKTLKNLS